MKKNKHKWKYRINVKKKILVLIILGVLVFVGIGFSILESNLGLGGTIEVSKYDKTLYSALKREVNKGYARKYTGSHQDSMDPTKSTEDIYHFYADTADAEKGEEIRDKNNVVFADTCWQMIRTTDTGGVRLLYNGEPEEIEVDGETRLNCGDTRNYYHMSIRDNTYTVSLNGTYIYAKNYTATTSGTTTTFTLVDDPDDPDDYKSITVNSTDAATQIADIVANYPYTCRNATGTCKNQNLYKIKGRASNTYAYYDNSTYRDVIAMGGYIRASDSMSLGNIGYMNNKKYISRTTSRDGYTLTLCNTSSSSNYKNYYFSDDFDFDEETYKVTLRNAVLGSQMADYPNSAENMFACTKANGEGTCLYMGYLTNSIFCTISVQNYGKKYLASKEYVDNGDGTVSLTNNVHEVKFEEFPGKNTSTYRYLCLPGTYIFDSTTGENVCSDNGELKDTIVSVGSWSGNGTIYYRMDPKPIYNIGNKMVKQNDAFYLANSNDEKATNYMRLSSAQNNVLANMHYSCLNYSGDCKDKYYYFYYSVANTGSDYSGNIRTIVINDGKYFSTDLDDENNVLNAAFYAEDVNTNNSDIKEIVDLWYESKLKNTLYESKLDDTIYCNNRSISSFGSFDPNGGSVRESLTFTADNTTTDLTCEKITDRFSNSNEKAKLKYKIGLMSLPEMNLLNQSNIQKNTYGYWLITPKSFGGGQYNFAIQSDGTLISNKSVSSSSYGYRPAISLIAGTKYSQGDGSMTNPYIVDMSN